MFGISTSMLSHSPKRLANTSSDRKSAQTALNFDNQRPPASLQIAMESVFVNCNALATSPKPPHRYLALQACMNSNLYIYTCRDEAVEEWQALEDGAPCQWSVMTIVQDSSCDEPLCQFCQLKADNLSVLDLERLVTSVDRREQL